MKKYFIILVSVLFFACDSEDANDCFQTAGSIIEQEIEVDFFNKILVHKDVELIVSQGTEQRVVIETGENLFNDVEVEVVDNQLVIKDNNGCNWIRDYGLTKAYVTVTEITEIRSATQYSITSIGTIQANELALISESHTNENYYNTADFTLSIDCDELEVVANGLSVFDIDGTVDYMFLAFYAGNGKFEGENLQADEIRIFHRGTNDLIINPINKLTGELRSTGDVISVNEPPIVDVEQFYTGQLFFD